MIEEIVTSGSLRFSLDARFFFFSLFQVTSEYPPFISLYEIAMICLDEIVWFIMFVDRIIRDELRVG